MTMDVEVCYATRTEATRVVVELDDGATVGEAVARSGIVARLGLDPETLAFAVFGRRATPQTRLRDRDRVELLRPLVVDPMEARRRRAAKKAANADPAGR